MASVDTSAALREARQAWEAGFSIVAAALNTVLAERCPGLSIASAPPTAGETLRQCRLVLLDALRRSLVPLPEPNKLAPWSLGYVNGTDNQEETRLGDAGLDPDETLKFVCKFLQGRTWKQSEWNSLIVLAVQRDAQKWRDEFAANMPSNWNPGEAVRSSAIRVLGIYTGNIASETFGKIRGIIDSDSLTLDDKLTQIHALMPIPPTTSAAKLGEALGNASKTAIQKTEWYIKNRKGEKENEVGRRHEQHRQRGQQYEPDRDE